MREDERKIATKLIKEGLARGWRVALHDEEGLAVAGRSFKAIEAELGACDYQQVVFYRDHGGDPQDNGPFVGTVTLVFGNEPGVLMADTSVSPVFSEFLAPIEEYQRKFEG